MTPLDIPRLNSDEYLGKPAILAAYQDLTKLTTRMVALHSLSLIPHVPQSFYCAWSGAIHIFIDEFSDRVNCSAVHELLHGILVEEGYCGIAAHLPSYLHGIFSNEMQHPEIFRRMEAYGLDMSGYWSYWDKELKRFLADMLDKLSYDKHAGACHMPQLFTWFFFQHISASYLEEYRRANSAAYLAARAAYEATKAIGFANMERYRQSLELFKGHWSRFCGDHLPGPFAQQLAATIREGAVTPLLDAENGRAAEEIMTLLNDNGLDEAGWGQK
ncbi:MAG TPA: hypothetical protein VND64_06465 [Pirellulales bacterium]|nr:hypothetical protein [Pirellulales bacterium]